jgi:iron complex outermembrane receptor protein
MDLPLSRATFSGHSLTLDWKADDALSIRSLSGYRTLKADAFQNYNEVFGSANYLTHDNYDHEQFSQELQLVGDPAGGRLNYVGGLYFFMERGAEVNLDPNTRQTTDSRSKSYAAYGQATQRSGQRLDITAGARVTRDERTGSNVLGSAAGSISSSVSDSLTFDSFDPALTVSYHWSDDVSTYAKAATAYRSGGLYFGHSIQYGNEYAPERLVSYEIGLKSQWLERRLRLNVAAYAGTLREMQFNFQLSATQSVLYNAGRAQINGVDLELEAHPVDDLSMHLEYSFLDAQLERVTGIAGSVFDPAVNPSCGCQVGDNVKGLFVVPRAPRNSVALGIDYSFAHVGEGVFSAHLDWRWQSEFFSNGPEVLNRQYARFPSYGLLNGRVGYSTPVRGGSRISASLWARNLLDETYQATLSGNGRAVPSAAGPAALTDTSSWWAEPRSYGVSLTFEF